MSRGSISLSRRPIIVSENNNKNKIATDCWKKGSEAMLKQNWDYSIDMFRKAVMLVPDNLTYRQSLRGVEKRKYNDNKTGAKMSGLRLTGVRTKIKNARRKKDWESVDQAAEDGLALNPWDPQLNADVGEACHQRGFPDVALFAYEQAVSLEPDNMQFNEVYANLLELRGNYADAIKCWERIHKLDPSDSRARSKITQLEASSVMDRGGYEGAKTTQDVKTGYDYDRPAKQTVPETVDGPGVSVEADLQRAIRKDETNKDNYLKLADFYRRQKKLEEAGKLLQTALELSGGDANIREQLEDIERLQLKQNFDLAMQAFEKNPKDEAARRNASALKRELREREITDFSRRVERYPKDNRLKFELATRFMRTKDRWKKAIPLLQQITNDNRLAAEARVALAKCFIEDKNRSLARHQLEAAVPKINSHDKAELYTDAHYLLARLCEDAGERDKAEHHYNEVLGVDYEYKDTRDRILRLQRGDEVGQSKAK